ncbi:MAG: hypothetical protein ACLFTR_00185 [Candidatus Woesearchaeota archaeon]
MSEKDLLESLFDDKLVRVLRVFFQFAQKKFYLKEVSEYSKVSMATAHRILTRLVKLNIITEIKISKFKVYQLAVNERTDFLSEFIKGSVKVTEVFVDMIKDDPSIQSVILVGKESESKANLIIIGDSVDGEKLKLATSEIKEKYNYKITYITMPKEQYDQMASMGLYPGTKKILFQKS